MTAPDPEDRSAPLKICVAVARFSFTGVPLAQIRLARALAARGHDVELLFGEAPQSGLPDMGGARLVILGCASVRQMVGPLCAYLRRAQPDVVFSSQDHLNGAMLLAAILTRSRAKISGSCRVNPFYTYSNRPFTRKWLFRQAMRAVMWRADALTCVSTAMIDEYRVFFRDPPHVTVHNLIDDAPSRARIGEPVEHPWFTAKDRPIVVTAGTLSPRKGHGDLIAAFARLVEQKRDIRLVIFGEGPSRTELEAQVAALGIGDRVSMPGKVANPLRYFARADVFALTSHFEGLPNVLIEAMMCGCSLVATDCPSGSSEALGHGRYGRVVPVGDVPAIADAIGAQLDHPTDPALLEEGVRRFAEDTVIERHFALLGLTGRERVEA
ncbi:glycosyltransferase [Sphingomonas jatrophae]|uniref:Glycosyltransferase involved in cell wall bisynthesis n=1 Tax=Sphingomonas jatrophae TaxID=1166337 RepID=A0A1I6L6D1_9SPHN|nr:glycosyltransferase [Sphingomonas jatrophae]SFR99019.1 Glycosyltransferase involved in cell wall bisynthesis [Sphingomonas jatrophae]